MYVCMYGIMYVRTARFSSRTYEMSETAPPVGTRAGSTKAGGMGVCEPRQRHTPIPQLRKTRTTRT